VLDCDARSESNLTNWNALPEEKSMKRKIFTFLVVVALGTSLGMTSAWAQADLAKSLVGKWEGEITLSGSAGSTSDPNRTLIIRSVEQKDGKMIATGTYGVTGKGLGKVEIEVIDSGGRPYLTFANATSTVRLTLTGPKDLTGTASIAGASSARGGDRPLKLEKKD
jgi:hypothetical protein